MSVPLAARRVDAEMQPQFAVVVGLDPGACNVGVCVWLATKSGPDVLEAVTVELDGIGPVAVAAAARLAVRTATEILADNADLVVAGAASAGVGVPVPLFCVENLVPPRRDTQQQRAVAQSTKVQSAVLSTGVSLGALLAALDGQLVQIVEPAGWDHRDGGPEVLRGRQPAGWRGRKGSERQHQRSAFFLSAEGLRAWLAAGNTPAPAAQADRHQSGPEPTRTDSATYAPGTHRAAPDHGRAASRTAPVAAATAEPCCIERQYGKEGCGHAQLSQATLTRRPGLLPKRPVPRSEDG